jgi:hypothetical protein
MALCSCEAQVLELSGNRFSLICHRSQGHSCGLGRTRHSRLTASGARRDRLGETSAVRRPANRALSIIIVNQEVVRLALLRSQRLPLCARLCAASDVRQVVCRAAETDEVTREKIALLGCGWAQKWGGRHGHGAGGMRAPEEEMLIGLSPPLPLCGKRSSSSCDLSPHSSEDNSAGRKAEEEQRRFNLFRVPLDWRCSPCSMLSIPLFLVCCIKEEGERAGGLSPPLCIRRKSKAVWRHPCYSPASAWRLAAAWGNAHSSGACLCAQKEKR